MNNSRFIHIMLVAVLCYAQLVSSIHAVGHLHEHAHKGLDQSPGDVYRVVSHHLASKAAMVEDRHAHHESADSDTETVADCAIYHTYLGQCIVLHSPGLHAVALLPRAVTPQRPLANLPGTEAENQPIRAPPALS